MLTFNPEHKEKDPRNPFPLPAQRKPALLSLPPKKTPPWLMVMGLFTQAFPFCMHVCETDSVFLFFSSSPGRRLTAACRAVSFFPQVDVE
jgi:hypothetical protein